MKLKKLAEQVGLLEITVFQLIIYSVIWLTNAYLGFLLTCVIIPLVLAVMLVSFLADRIETSGVSYNYYLLMLSFVVCPLIITAVFIYSGVDVGAWFTKE